MTRTRQHGTPLVVPPSGVEGQASWLERIRFGGGSAGEVTYDERWLQALVQEYPELLPVDEIEPAYRPLIPVCMELPTPRGFIDNFLITPSGNLIFVECKLWRNTESRREVVAQVMDYVESVSGWTYGELEAAVARAETTKGSTTAAGLYDLVAGQAELDEPGFIDAVSRNLRLGRGLFFIVGDGIREEVETLTGQLQSHAGMHFALALVEIACYRLPDNNSILLQPRTLARTVNIERGIVRIEDSRAVIGAPEKRPRESQAAARQSLSAEEFFEQLAQNDPALPVRVRELLDRLEPLGIEPEFKRSLILTWRSVDGTRFNLGYIQTAGDVWTDMVNQHARKLGVLDLSHGYVRELAGAVGGEVRSLPSNADSTYVALGGKAVRIGALLDHKDDWEGAIGRFCERVNARLEEASD